MQLQAVQIFAAPLLSVYLKANLKLFFALDPDGCPTRRPSALLSKCV